VRAAAILVPGHGSVADRAAADTPIGRLEQDRGYLDRLHGGTRDPRLRDAPDWLRDQDERNRDWLT